MPEAEAVRALARERLGFESLRPGQLEGVLSATSGRDTLCVMSTGSGKTAIYHLAGLFLDGPTIVVSPLISLQRDQMEIAEQEGVAGARMLNSDLSEAEREEVFDALERGEVEFLLTTPEQLARDEVTRRIAAAGPSLFVVDEAHCVSQWGHDFRPEYLDLPEAAEALGRPPVLALTATAAPPVRSEIVAALRLSDPEIIVRGFDRPNIHLAVERFSEEQLKRERLREAVLEAEGAGIVYVATKRGADEIAAELRAAGVAADAYHAGLPRRQRESVQERFMGDELRVVVATIAFGMGIDKPDVRWVFHHDIPGSVDSYYQEIGRAGRDGKPARALLLYRPEDLGLRRYFASSTLEPDEVERVGRILAAAGRPATPRELQAEAEISESKLAGALHRLGEAGFATPAPGDRYRAEGGEEELRRAVERAARLEAERESFERSRVDMIRAYAEREGCRRAFILGYFGEDFDPPCGNCDNCEAGRGADAPTSHGALDIGVRVRHPDWGRGTVSGLDEGRITVVFDEFGYKTLDLALVDERRLLEPISE